MCVYWKNCLGSLTCGQNGLSDLLPEDKALSWLLDYERIQSYKLKLPLSTKKFYFSSSVQFKIDFFDSATLKETWIAVSYHIYLNLESY